MKNGIKDSLTPCFSLSAFNSCRTLQKRPLARQNPEISYRSREKHAITKCRKQSSCKLSTGPPRGGSRGKLPQDLKIQGGS